jgi:hypothetical protein
VFCFFPIPYTKDHRILESDPASWPQWQRAASCSRGTLTGREGGVSKLQSE